MKILKYIFLLLLLIIVAGSIYIATLKNSYDVARTKVIKAPVAVIFSEVNDFNKRANWSPWIEKEPDATYNYSKESTGKGSSFGWKGDVLGEGNLETINTYLLDSIHRSIKFLKPFESNADIYWNFKPVADGTEVTWGMKGKLSFVSRAYMAITGGMEKQVGPDYERGLFKLDSVVQENMKKYSIKVAGITTHGGGFYLYNSTSCKIEELPAKMQEMMPKVMDYAQKNNIQMAGVPFTVYHTFDQENDAVMFSCAVPVSERVITESGSGILTGMLKPFKAVKTTLKGNYKNSKEAWETTYNYLGKNKLEQVKGGPAVEMYLTDPMRTPNPADWITEIFVPVK